MTLIKYNSQGGKQRKRTILLAAVIVLLAALPIGTYYDTSQASLASQNAQIASLSAQLASIKDQLSALNAGVSTLNSRITTLQTDLDLVSGFLSLIPTNTTAIKLIPQLTAESIMSGNSATLSGELFNSLDTANRIPSNYKWGLPALTTVPCGDLPIAFGAFRGQYTMANISGGKPLAIFNPYPPPCPISATTIIVFYPLSESGLALANSGNSSTFYNLSLFSSVRLSGYWKVSSSTAATFTPFEPGEYTLAVGDGWGGIAILYLRVV